MTLTRETVTALRDDPARVALDEDNDAYLLPSGAENNLVAIPARDDFAGEYQTLNPAIWQKMVERFNAAPDLATALLSAWAERDALAVIAQKANEHLCGAISERDRARTRALDAEAKLAERDAENARLREWQDVVFWTDDDEKTFFSWAAGGGDPDGEFSKIGLRRITPDGTEVFREYVALSPWHPAILAPITQPKSDALARVRAEAVTVKPLVWSDADANGGFYAEIPIKNLFSGYYQITQEEYGLATVEFGIHCHEFGRDVIWKGPSAGAKAAAQADHEARIRAAIGGVE